MNEFTIIVIVLLVMIMGALLFPRSKKVLCPNCGNKLFDNNRYSGGRSLGLKCLRCGCRCDFEGKKFLDEEDEKKFRKLYFNKTIFRTAVICLTILIGAFISMRMSMDPDSYFSNPKICEDDVMSGVKDECYYKLALRNDDVLICEEISIDEIEYSREKCYMHFITTTKNHLLCNNLEKNRDSCFFNLAVDQKKPSICYNIDSKNNLYRQMCLTEATSSIS